MATHWMRLERRVNDKETLELRWRQAKQDAGDIYGNSHTPSRVIEESTGNGTSTARPATAKAMLPTTRQPVDDEIVIYLGPNFWHGLVWVVLGFGVFFLLAFWAVEVGVFLLVLLGIWFVVAILQNPLALLLILLFGNC